MMAKKSVSGTGLYRQGDVLICRIDPAKVPAETTEIPREAGRVILAHGEVTGHAHAIRNRNVCFLRAEGHTDRFLQVSVTSNLEHEEHDTIALPPGTYRVRIQREWSGEVSRRVED